MAGRRIWIVIGLLVLALLVYAAIDGGRKPLRQIEEPVAVPENLQ